MSERVITKLFQSFDDLEQAISLARDAIIKQNPVPFELLRRVATYQKTLEHQRRLGHSLGDLIAEANWEEVSRHVRMINGMSDLIHADARQLVAKILDTSSADEHDKQLA